MRVMVRMNIDDELEPKVKAQEEYDSKGISIVVAESEIKCRRFTLWDQLGDKAKEILMAAPMNQK